MNTPAGWYPDPSDSSKERFWDGSSWTPDVRAGGAGDQPESSALGALFEPPGQSRGGGTPASWWEEDEEPQSTEQLSVQAPSEMEERPHQDVRTRNRRGGGRRGYRSLLTRFGAGALILAALFVARAEQQRSEAPPPPVVDSLPTVPVEPSSPVEPTGISGDLSGIGDTDTGIDTVIDTGIDTGIDTALDGLNDAEPDPAPIVRVTPSPTNTPKSPSSPAGESRPSSPSAAVPTKVRFQGSSFGPNGLLAVSWSAPTKAPSGTRYLVEVKHNGVVKRIRTSSTEALFRNVGTQDCTVKISAYTSAGSSPAVTLRCGS